MIEMFNPKVDCYTCIHRGSVVGSAHSCCNHPGLKVELKALILLNYARGLGSTNPTGIKVKVTQNGFTKEFPLQKWNEIGVRNGYVLYPDNFDPVWLENCFIYEGIKPKPVEPV